MAPPIICFQTEDKISYPRLLRKCVESSKSPGCTPVATILRPTPHASARTLPLHSPYAHCATSIPTSGPVFCPVFRRLFVQFHLRNPHYSHPFSSSSNKNVACPSTQPCVSAISPVLHSHVWRKLFRTQSLPKRWSPRTSRQHRTVITNTTTARCHRLSTSWANGYSFVAPTTCREFPAYITKALPHNVYILRRCSDNKALKSPVNAARLRPYWTPDDRPTNPLEGDTDPVQTNLKAIPNTTTDLPTDSSAQAPAKPTNTRPTPRRTSLRLTTTSTS